MNLREYIEAMGDDIAAKRLGISPRAAKSYRLGVRLPRPAAARQMVKRSRGALSLQAIYGR